jgi:monothiol glutaredoxin
MREELRQKIQETVGKNRVVLFMKGTKNFPQCGFSARVVDALKRTGVGFAEVNVLADSELREAMKEFSNWPTFPQLYVAGKLVGGADIVTELEQSGELQSIVQG